MRGRLVPLLRFAVALLAARAASAGIVMTMEPAAPGSTDVVVRWAADASSPGPYQLLKRQLLEPLSVAESLPLDPVLHAYVSGIAGNELRLTGEAAAPSVTGVWLYQLVDATGGCSNVGYVVLRGQVFGFGTTDSPDDLLALPGLHAYRSARLLLNHFPSLRRVQVRRDDCIVQYLERDGSGFFSGQDFVVKGDSAVECYVSTPYFSNIVGASTVRSVPLRLSNALAEACSRTSMTAAVPYGYPKGPVELLCGDENVDWFDANSDTLPDTCSAGLHPGVDDESTTIQVALNGVPSFSTFNFVSNGFPSLPSFFLEIEWFAPGNGLDVSWFPSLGPVQEVEVPDAGDVPACRCADSDGDGADDCLEVLEGTDPLDPGSVGPDSDRDGVADEVDLCPTVADPTQSNDDGDDFGDACDPCPTDARNACVDPDGDGFLTGEDNCPDVFNDQSNSDLDLPGDACDLCPFVTDSQGDSDGDGFGDACDTCPLDPDVDGDQLCDFFDNCPLVANPLQEDADFDAIGDACDCLIGPGTSASVPLEVTDLHVQFPLVGTRFLRLLTWNDLRPVDHVVATFDVVSGRLEDLWSSRSFDGAECLVTGLDAARHVDAFTPDSRWYLVRATNPCGTGTFGTSSGPTNPRARLDDAATSPCP